MKNKERAIWIWLVVLFIIVAGVYFFNTQETKKSLLALTKEKNYLSETIKTQEAQMLLFKKQINKLHGDLQRIQEEKSQMEQKLKREKAIAVLKCINEQKKLADENLHLQEKVAKLKQEKKKLLETNKENAAFTSELFQKFLQAENARSKLLKENKKLALANEKLRKEIIILKTEKKELVTQLTATKKKIRAREQALAATRTEKEKLAQQLIATQEEIQVAKQTLARMQKEKDRLAKKVERLKFDLKVCLSVNDRLNTEIAKLSNRAEPVVVGKIYFSTGSTAVDTDRLAKIAAAIQKYDPKKFVCVLRGAADRQPYKNKSVYRNSQLSARRALAVEYALLYAYKIKLPIIVEGRGNFFARLPENNQDERRVEIIILKKEALK